MWFTIWETTVPSVIARLAGFILLAAGLLLTVRSASAQKSSSDGEREEEEILEAVVRDRLRLGHVPLSIGPPPSSQELEHFFRPVFAVCLSLPNGQDPSDDLLGRFKPPYAIMKASKCRFGDPRDYPPMLTIGPVRRTNGDTVEVGWDGLGNEGWYRVKREKGRWKAVGPVEGFVG